MGKLIYGPLGTQFEIDDRALAHVQVTILSKLRRGESFAFTWKPPADSGEGRSVIWFHPSHAVQFKFNGSKPLALNRAWIEELMTSANSVGGLQITPEPTAPKD